MSNRTAVLLYVFLAVFSGLGLLGKTQLVRHIIQLPIPVVYIVVILWILLPLTCLLALEARRYIAPLVFLGIICASLFIYPRMQELQQRAGRGTDQPDCVIVAAKGLGSAEWPYDTAKLWSHNPMSCGPGWVLLQTPVILTAGYRWNLLVLWALAIILLRSRITHKGVMGVLTLVGLAAITWVAASDGTDFLPFGILLAALFVVVQTKSRWYPFSVFLLTLVVQFRFPMLILPALIFPLKRLRHGVMVSLAAFCFQLGFLLWRPEAYITGGPLNLFYKLTHTHLLAPGRWTATLEVSIIFALMLGTAILVRRYFASSWVGFAYLLALTVLPAALDLVQKIRGFGSLLGGLGFWEGTNWISGCLPLAALFLLINAGDLQVPGELNTLNDSLSA